jgi:hypothetical protein
MKANQEEMTAKMEAERKADKAELMAEINSNQEKMDANQQETRAAINSLRSALGGAIKTRVEMKACREVTYACLEEEKKPTPEEPKAVAESEEVPE